jgi:hypothetical protein
MMIFQNLSNTWMNIDVLMTASFGTALLTGILLVAAAVVAMAIAAVVDGLVRHAIRSIARR